MNNNKTIPSKEIKQTSQLKINIAYFNKFKLSFLNAQMILAHSSKVTVLTDERE